MDFYTKHLNLHLQERHPFKQLFYPTKEVKEGEEEIFLSDEPQNILESEDYNQVPFITGVNSIEGSVILPGKFYKVISTHEY